MKYRRIVLIAPTMAIVLALSGLYISKPHPLATRADPQAEPAPQLGATQEDCNSIVDIARDLQRRRTAGLTEDPALAEMSARGRYLLGYVVDGVFRADPDTSANITLDAIWKKCNQSGRFGVHQ